MKLFHSFRYAFQGLRFGFGERNMKIHVMVALLVIAMGLALSLSLIEWSVLLLSIGLVLTTELLNTGLEKTLDLVTKHSPNAYDGAGKPKDIAAAAVLVASVSAAVVGVCVIGPHVLPILLTVFQAS